MIKQLVMIPNATAQQVYELLTDSAKHTVLTSSLANIDPRKGGQFSTFDGYATGSIIDLKPYSLIEQTWRADDWPGGHLSKIKFELADNHQGTQIEFTQSNIPEGREPEYEAGWDDFYWSPLKEYFSK